MKKQRLSKLQKWILRNCYHEQNGQVFKAMKKEDVFRFFKSTYFIGSQELVLSNNFKGFMPLSDYNKAHATISRSLSVLRDKGLVKLIGKKRVEEPDWEGAMELRNKYKTKEELETAIKGMSVDEMMKMTNKFTEGKKVDIAVEIKDNNKANVKIVELTDLGVEKTKELLLLSS